MATETLNKPLQAVLDTTLAREIVEDGIRRYIASRRNKVDAFVDKHFSRKGAWELRTPIFRIAPINVGPGSLNVY